MGYGDFHLEVTASLPAQGMTVAESHRSAGEQFLDHRETSESEFQLKTVNQFQGKLAHPILHL